MSVEHIVYEIVNNNKVVVFTSNDSWETGRIKELIEQHRGTYHEVNVDRLDRPNEIKKYLASLLEISDPTPSVFVEGQPIGGYNQLARALFTGQIRNL